MQNKENYTKFALKGAAIVFIASLLAAFLGYLVRLVMARNLSMEDFGLFNAVFAFLGLVGSFKSLGFDKALIKFIPEFRHQKRYDLIKSSIIFVCLIQLITNIAIIFGIYIFSGYVSEHFFHTQAAEPLLRLLVFAFAIDSFVMVLKFAFQGFKDMLNFSLIDVARMAIVLIVIIIGIERNYGVMGPVIGYIVAPLVLIPIFGLIFFRKTFPGFFVTKAAFDKGNFKGISKYGIFVTETALAGMILYYTDIMALTYLSGLTAVALYSIAMPTAKLLIYFTRAIGGVFLPLSAELWASGKKALLKVSVELLYKYSIIIMLPLVLLMFAFSDLIITLFYGTEYIEAANSMKILSIGMFFTVFNGIQISFFSGIGKPQIGSIINYGAAGVNLVLNILLIPFFGIEGAAVATSISYFIMLAMGVWYMNKYIKIDVPIKMWVYSICIGLVFLGTILAMKRMLAMNWVLELAVILVVSGSIYAGLLFVTGVVKISELRDIYKRLA
jgi:O-antigen/teichoic acid export membrane protein